jgi:hypothetical protein
MTKAKQGRSRGDIPLGPPLPSLLFHRTWRPSRARPCVWLCFQHVLRVYIVCRRTQTCKQRKEFDTCGIW